MAWLFSKRYSDLIKEEKIRVSITLQVRRRLMRLLQSFNEATYMKDDSGFNYESDILSLVEKRLKDELGIEELISYKEDGSGRRSPGTLEEYLLRGIIPPHVFDILEIMYEEGENAYADAFQSGLNSIFEESEMEWRMANGRIYKIDSVYIENQILKKCHELLRMQGFEGALLEFEKSRVYLEQGDYQNAIQNANLSIESTIKGVLGIDKAKPGDLYRMLRESTLIPEYYGGFLKSFEEHMIRCPAICRNFEGGAGHGQGPDVNIIPRPLAEFTINMAAVLINYILNMYAHTDNGEDEEEGGEEFLEDDFVF